jgi:hypothetical protein
VTAARLPTLSSRTRRSAPALAHHAGPAGNPSPCARGIAPSRRDDLRPHRFCGRRDLPGQRHIVRREPTGIVRGQQHMHPPPPDIEIRMVVHRLGEKPDPRDKGNRLREPGARVTGHYRITNPTPTGKIHKRGRHRCIRQSFHERHSRGDMHYRPPSAPTPSLAFSAFIR